MNESSPTMPAVEFLPIYRVGSHEDRVNLVKLAEFVGWTDVQIESTYTIREFQRLPSGNAQVDRVGVCPQSQELVRLSTLPLGILVGFSPEKHCVVQTTFAIVDAGGVTVSGTLLEDGWHGSLGEAIELANAVVMSRVQALKKAPRFKFYPKSMWR